MDHVDFIMIVAAVCVLAFTYVQYRKDLKHPPVPVSTDVHIDIETRSLEPNAAILTIGAAAFDEFGQLLSEFYVRINVQDSERHGHVDQGTDIEFWQNPKEVSEEARYEAFERTPRAPFDKALRQLADWYMSIPTRGMKRNDFTVWANSPSFDCVILRHAFKLLGIDCSWRFYQERCVRTIAAIAKERGFDFKNETDFVGTAHRALDDAKHQARYTHKALSAMFFVQKPWLIYLIKKFG